MTPEQLSFVSHQWARANQPNWHWWLTLDDETREAMATACDAVARERMAWMGYAMLGPESIAELLVDSDGGDAVVEMELRAAAERAANAMRAKHAN